MSSIIIKDLSFAYPGGEPVFSNLSINIDTIWRLGLVGRNGCGKSTFLRLLELRLEHKGIIDIPFPLGYFPISAPDQTQCGLDLLKSFSPMGEADGWKLKREAQYLKLSEEALLRPLSELSGGEITKVLLALLFIGDEVFPLIDEPTENLDLEGRKVLAGYLASKSGFIIVSHDRELLDACVDHILAINRDGVELEKGNFSSWWESRRRRVKSEELAKLKLKKDAERLEAAAERSSVWAKKAEKTKYGCGPVDRGFIGHKAAKVNKRVKSIQARREKAALEMTSLVKKAQVPSEFFLKPLQWKGGLIAWGKDLTAGYTEKAILKNFSFTVAQGERLAVTGPNGSGKSLFLKLLCGSALVLDGELCLSERVKISYVPQRAENFNGCLREFASERGLNESLFKAVLNQLGFSRRHMDAHFSELSLGQQKKAFLAASLLTEAHLYIWDEPLSHVDAITRMEIEHMLSRSKITLVICEHDLRFLKAVATSFLELR
jgi:lincosamide and streptogramin A transport system ATP-binding/permease protein